MMIFISISLSAMHKASVAVIINGSSAQCVVDCPGTIILHEHVEKALYSRAIQEAQKYNIKAPFCARWDFFITASFKRHLEKLSSSAVYQFKMDAGWQAPCPNEVCRIQSAASCPLQ